MRNYDDVHVDGDDDDFFNSLKEKKEAPIRHKEAPKEVYTGKELFDQILRTNNMLNNASGMTCGYYGGYSGLSQASQASQESSDKKKSPATKHKITAKKVIKKTWSDDEDDDDYYDDEDDNGIKKDTNVSKPFERGSFMAVEKRENDLILAPNEYVLVSDETSGKVNVIVGPKKESLAGTDQPMRFDGKTQRYIRCSLADAIQRMPYADERSYIILQNPAANESNPYPKAGTSNSLGELKVGQSINIKGPTTFALWPGQVADVIPGHQLRSNQYLLIRITNVDHAYGDQEVVKDEVRLATGQLNIIKGTETAFYIPPTGIEVLKDDNDEYVRDALTLERLEYCVLKDESGEKRYVRGPAVVFPKPTETFVERGSGNTKSESGTSRKFKAVELNDNMGLYIKVISDYTDGEGKNAKEIKAGEELFITGKDQKIYFPRPEHAIIKYGQQIIHYAVAVPKGEARYVLDKNTGSVRTIRGPMMFMPDPRTDVIVKRVLSAKEVELWFPGNQEALQYNVKSLGENMVTEGMTAYYAADMSAKKLSATAGQYSRSTMRFSDDAVLDDFADGVKRQTEFTPPRTITLDNKFEGAVSINVWPGYAVQVVNRTGERKVVQGPQTILLDYDQTLETLALSTGRPKTDTKLLRTVYLHVQNNKVSDQVTVQTKDLVDVGFQLSYKVNFEGDSSKWFSVQNYIKLMTDNLRSIIRKEIKSYGIQEINNNAIAIIRDVILGKKDEETGERKHRTFDENGMTVYDVEILGIEIGNKRISELLTNAQHTTVSNTIELAQAQANLNLVKERQRVERETLEEQRLTQEKKLANDKALTEKIIETEAMKHNFEVEKAKVQSILAAEELTRESNAKGVEVSVMKEKIKIQTEALVSQMNAISPDLIAAINSLGDKQLATALAENLPKATGTAGYLFGNGGIEGLLKMVAGTPLEASLKEITSKKNTKKTAE